MSNTGLPLMDPCLLAWYLPPISILLPVHQYIVMSAPDDSPLFAALADATFRAMQQAVIRLPPDVKRALARVAKEEKNPVARGEFENIFKNIDEAERNGLPLCQDTGVPVVYLTIPP